MTNMERFRLVTKNQLNPEQRQLFDLVLATGITIHPKIFKVLMDLLALNVPPHAILSLLREVHDKIPQDMNENFTAWDHTDGSHT
ncbi:mitotic-spindle organizing protein 2-like [Portunus trituberculatus]|uniref:mitotic-spindle organizing protein 2-like n=1 Tax=Portunus trituberculatus TaxID=210409 RepID=UPI001E1CC9D3|nr:mitotic-spindle organizing protein 2-like [Portunus trituberculatus]XP_045128072.1 mitotic-spindle organizing protein 2-like [Portunus trituberculatus]